MHHLYIIWENGGMKDLVNKSINANQIIGITTLTGKLFFYDGNNEKEVVNS